jgi:hypothetical protein
MIFLTGSEEGVALGKGAILIHLEGENPMG